MPQKIAKNTFIKGMNLDADITMQPKGTYRECNEFRLSVDEDGNFGTLQNVKGNNRLLSDIHIQPDHTIVGHAELNDDVILFIVDDTETYSYISRFKFNGEFVDASTDTYAEALLWTDDGKAVDDRLNLSMSYPIKAITRKESTDIEKIYWVDGNNNYLRYVNVAEYLTTDGLVKSVSNDYVSAKTFGTVADVTFTEPELVSSGSGGLNVGVVQYAYQLYNKNGSESGFSPATGLYHLSSSSDDTATTQDYKGNPQGEESGKSFTFDITLSTYEYDSIRIVSIFYDYYSQLPTINIINEKKITSSGIIRFTDRGSDYIGSYTIEQFTAIAGLYKAKDIASSKNFLFLANTTENYFDIGIYDARAYRFRDYDSTISANTYEGDGTKYIFEANGDWEYKSAGNVLLDSGSDWSVPVDADLINYFNDPTNDGIEGIWSDLSKQADGATLGGTGKNITYEFVYDNYHIDTDEYAYTLRASDKDATLGFTGFYSPNNTANNRGYQRDETYRFGIVFFDKYGRESIVEWIGDIRMPKIRDYSIGEYNTTYNSVYSIAPEFTVNSYPTGAVSYKIVRLERNTEDKSIVASGILRPTMYTKAAGNNRQIFHTTGSGDSLVTEDWVKYDLQEFISPEISFYKNLQVLGSDAIEVHNISDLIDYDPWGHDSTANGDDVQLKIRTVSADTTPTTLSIAAGKIVQPMFEDEVTPISNLSYYGYFKGDDDFAEKNGINGTSLIFKDASATDIYDVSDPDGFTKQYIKYGIYKRDVFSSQYGGNTYSNRTNNEYIGTSPIVTIPEYIAEVTETTEHTTDISISNDTVLDYSSVNNTVYITYTLPAEYLDFVSIQEGTGTLRLQIGYTLESGIPIYDSQSTGDTITIESYSVIDDILHIHIATSGNLAEVEFFNDIDIVTLSNVSITYNTTTVISPEVTNETTIGSKHGDIFVGYHEHMILSQTGNGDDVFLNVMFPCESSINLALRHDDRFSTVYTNTSHDYVNLRELGSEDYNLSVMYLYNTAYSQENTLKKYFPLPEGEEFEDTKAFNTRIIVSERKFNGEESDSWLQFLTNNFIDVDANYGELTNIEDHNNNLLFWQPRAFGMTDVDPRSLITDNSPGTLVLGTGVVLSRFDYLSTMTGNTDDFGIIKSPKGFYWFDGINNLIVKYDNKNILRISKLKGIQSFLNEGKYSNCVTSYLSKYDEILFTLTSGDSDDTTIVFNEMTNSFTGFYSMIPTQSFNINNYLYTTTNNHDVYIHDAVASPYGKYYGTSTNYSTIKVPIIDNPDIVKVFDIINFPAYVYNSNGVLQYNLTVDEIRCYNSYQNTDTISLTPSTNISRKKGMWSLPVPRNAVDKNVGTNPDIFDNNNLDVTQLHKTRMRDLYMITDFTYENASNYRFKLPFIHTKYRANFR